MKQTLQLELSQEEKNKLYWAVRRLDEIHERAETDEADVEYKNVKYSADDINFFYEICEALWETEKILLKRIED